MSLRIHDLLELTDIPALGDTIGPAGTGATVGTVAGPEFMDLPSSGASVANLYEPGSTAVAPHDVLVDGETFTPVEIFEVQVTVDGQIVAGIVVSLQSSLDGTTRQFLIPQDGYAFTGSETMTISGLVDVLSVETADFVEDDMPPVCFAHGTLIATPEGLAPVESISAGHRISTLDHGAMRVLFVADCHASPEEQAARRALRPVEIDTGAFGHGLPHRPLVVSPQHRLLVSGRIVQRMTGHPRALVPAKTFAAAPGIRWKAVAEPVSFRHLLLERHALICAESLPSESLWLGPMAERSLSPEQLAEARAALREAGAPPPAAACPVLGGQRARRLVERHARNGTPLIDARTADAVRRLEAVVRRPAA